MTVPSITPAPIDATASSVRQARAELAAAEEAHATATAAHDAAHDVLLDAENRLIDARHDHAEALAAWDALGRSLEPEEGSTTP